MHCHLLILKNTKRPNKALKELNQKKVLKVILITDYLEPQFQMELSFVQMKLIKQLKISLILKSPRLWPDLQQGSPNIPNTLKVSQIIMVPKPEKDPEGASSYRPISLLPTLSKIFEKTYIRRLISIIHQKQWMSEDQFGFGEKHRIAEH